MTAFLAGFALHDAVKASAEHGDGGTDGCLHRDLVTERQDGETNHENSLPDVTDGVRHRSDLAERLIRDLVVHVVIETDESESGEELGFALERDSLGDTRRQCGAFKVKGER
jgi:hypothetical protein